MEPAAYGRAITTVDWRWTPSLRIGQRLNADLLDAPIRQPRAIDPMIEESLPRLTRIFLEIALKSGDAQDAPGMPLIDQTHEIKKRFLAQSMLDHAYDLAAALITHTIQIGYMTELGDVLYGRCRLSAGQRAVQIEIPVIVATHIRQPFETFRVINKQVVRPILGFHETIGKISGQALIHPGFAVAVRADDVVPPLMARGLGNQIIDESLGQVRHVENA
jgi:hypothetical protein